MSLLKRRLSLSISILCFSIIGLLNSGCQKEVRADVLGTQTRDTCNATNAVLSLVPTAKVVKNQAFTAFTVVSYGLFHLVYGRYIDEMLSCTV
jgi:hypothetical protein